MPHISLVNEAQKFISKHLQEDSLAIDATMGNGNDTVFLAQTVGKGGKVYSFDIQETALRNTQQKLNQLTLKPAVELICANHTLMKEYIPQKHWGEISCIMFNLGYLPGADKSIITQTRSTLTALSISLELLSPKGCLSVVLYPGHPGGDSEAKAVLNWNAQLDQTHYKSQLIAPVGTKNKAPNLLMISSQ